MQKYWVKAVINNLLKGGIAMRVKKMLAALTAVIMCCCALTGCIGMVANTTINADGSGTVMIKAGISENSMEFIEALGESGGSANTTGTEQEFVHNGVKYLGAIESYNFSSVEEFNTIMAENSEDEDTGVKMGLINLVKENDGTFTLTLNADNETGNTEEMETQLSSEDVGLSDEEIELMLADMAIVFSFELPAEVKQVAGETAGVTVSGKSLTIDVMELSKKLGGKDDKLVFKTGKIGGDTVINPPVPEEPVVEPDKEVIEAVVPITGEYMFSDVYTSDWYCTAVNAMAKKGLVNGVGGGKFAPKNTLTYAQFCQIIAKAKGLETGEQNGYWAYSAIKSCRDKGYIIDLGAYTSVNYDVPMTREAAVAGMFRAYATELYSQGKVGQSVTDAHIPDYKSIDDNYKNDIVDAYNSGITSGVDSSKTFNPKGILTRAEICQLLYNFYSK